MYPSGAAGSSIARHIEAKGLSYFVVHLKQTAFFEVGYYSASKGVEHITEEISFGYHASDVLNMLDQGRLPPTLALILECAEVQSCGDVFTDKKPYYCIKIYEYFIKDRSEQVKMRMKVVQWVREEDLPSHLDLYPNHLPLLKDEPDMGEDDSAFALRVTSRPWFQRAFYFRQRLVTRRSAGRAGEGGPDSDLQLVLAATLKREEAVERLASTRRVTLRQQNFLGADSSSQLAVTRDLATDFPISLSEASSPETPLEWPTEFTMEPLVDLELFTHPPNRLPSRLRLSVSRRLPDQRLFGRFSCESAVSGEQANSTAEYSAALGTPPWDIEHFLRQYTELVTDKGRCPAQVTLTYAGQQPAVFKDYPFFFGKRAEDDLDLPGLMRLSLGPQLPVADEKLATQRTVG